MTPPGPASARRPTGRRAALLLTFAGAAITGLAAVQTWAAGSLADPVLGRQDVAVPGTAAVPALLLLVAVAVAGMLASTIGGRVLRVVSGTAIVVAGGAVAGLAARSAADPAASLLLPAAAASGRVGAPLDAASATGWPWGAVAGGMALLVAGFLVIRGGAAWAGGARRFERTAAGNGAIPDATARTDDSTPAPDGPQRRDGVHYWERLSRDEDPTA